MKNIMPDLGCVGVSHSGLLNQCTNVSAVDSALVKIGVRNLSAMLLPSVGLMSWVICPIKFTPEISSEGIKNDVN